MPENKSTSTSATAELDGKLRSTSNKPATLTLRPALPADADLLFEWRNDEQTRLNSINQEEVPYNQHLAWFENALSGTVDKVFIAEVGNVPVGTIREETNHTPTEVSWTVSPQARGQGIGKQMMATFIAQSAQHMMAIIREDNLASIKIATHAGFKFAERNGALLYYIYSPVS